MTEDLAAHRSVWTSLYNVSFRQGWVDAGAVSTRYVEAGPADAPVLIMIHGTAGSWEGFCANIGPLSKHFRCLALDMVGCGFSSPRDVVYEMPVYVQHLHDFMRVMNVSRATFVGVSMGAWICASFAAAYPSKTDGLVLVSAAGLVARSDVGRKVAQARGSATENPSWETVQPIFSNLILKEENRIPDLVAVRLASYQRPEMKASMRSILALLEPGTWERNLLSEAQWRAITAPVLVIAAVDKPDTYLEDGLRIAELVPNARVVEIRQASHWAQFEAPAEFNHAVIEFMQASVPA